MEQSELKVIERLLGIKDVRVIGYRETVNNEAIITVESKSEVVYCQHCSKPCVAHGRAMPIQIQHLPLLGKTTYIEISHHEVNVNTAIKVQLQLKKQAGITGKPKALLPMKIGQC